MQFWEQNIKNRGFKDLEEAVRDFQRKNYNTRYVGATLSKLEIPDWAGVIASEFMKNPKNILLYQGSPGCGKTEFCSALTEWALQTFSSFRKFNELDLLSRLREGISNGDGDYAKNLQYLIDDDFVILDDVGSGINPKKVTYKDLEWKREIFFTFLDLRYNSQKPTVITSNFNRQEFEDIYSERISSRLFAEENKFISIFGEGVDKRKQGY